MEKIRFRNWKIRVAIVFVGSLLLSYFLAQTAIPGSMAHAGITPMTEEEFCRSCHGTNTSDQHHLLVGTSLQDPTVAPNVQPDDAVEGYGCLTCHLEGGPGGFIVIRDCTVCHGDYFDDHMYGDNHLYTKYNPDTDLAQEAPGTPCVVCHDDNGGDLATWPDIRTEHAVPTNGPGPCDTCHRSDRDEVQLTIQNGQAGETQNCLDCHSDKETPATHGYVPHEPPGYVTKFEGCVTSGCHDGNEVVLDIHNAECGHCHTQIPALQPGLSAGNCIHCHPDRVVLTGTHITYGGAHHENPHAQIGDCDWCHPDPRPGWALEFNTFLPDPLPKQLACVKCHVEPGGTGLEVYKNTYTPVNLSSDPGTRFEVDGAARVEQSPIHTIDGAEKINVYNYGVCLECHQDSDRVGFNALLQVWHAKPTWNKYTHDTAWSNRDNPFDTLRYAPGRSEVAHHDKDSNTIIDSKFNIFYDGAYTGTQKARMFGRYRFSDDWDEPYEDTNSEDRGDDLYDDFSKNEDNPWYQDRWPNSQKVTIPCIPQLNDPWSICNGYDPRVPVFPDIPEPSPPDGGEPPPQNDSVNITYASYSSYYDRLTIYAENSLGNNATLSVIYDGSSYEMNWDYSDDRWEIRINSSTCNDSTIEVVSSAGGSDTNSVSNCSGGSTPPPQNDSVTITRAEYDNDHEELEVWAENALDNNATLSVLYDGSSYAMKWDSGDDRWEIIINSSRCDDSTIDVVSSAGGSDTSSVKDCSSYWWR